MCFVRFCFHSLIHSFTLNVSQMCALLFAVYCFKLLWADAFASSGKRFTFPERHETTSIYVVQVSILLMLQLHIEQSSFPYACGDLIYVFDFELRFCFFSAAGVRHIYFVIVAHFCCFEQNRIKKDTIFFFFLQSFRLIHACVVTNPFIIYGAYLKITFLFDSLKRINSMVFFFVVRSFVCWMPAVFRLFASFRICNGRQIESERASVWANHIWKRTHFRCEMQ